MAHLKRMLFAKNTLKSAMFVLGAVGTYDFVTHNIYEKERKRLTRVTKSVQDQFGGKGQFELLKSNISLLITPSFGYMHSFDQFKRIEDIDDYATEKHLIFSNCQPIKMLF